MILPIGILFSLALTFAVGACSVPLAQGQMMPESAYLGSASGEKATGTGHFGKNPADMTSFEVMTDYFTRRSEEEERERADREKRMRTMSNYSNMTQGGESYFDRLYYQPMVGAR